MSESPSDNSDTTEARPKAAPLLGLVSWALYDWANSAYWTVIQTFVFAAYFVRRVAASTTDGTAWWGTTIGLAGLVVAVSGPVLGAIADQKGRRKGWIAACTLLAVGATSLLWFVQPSPAYVWLALPLVGLATVGAELSIIFYNAMLPRLASPDTVGRWSGWGWGLGYAGGLLCLVLVLLVLLRPQDPWFGLERQQAEHLRAAPLVVAGWYLLFSLPLFLFTPDVPAKGKSLVQAARDGLRQLRDTVREVRRYRHLVRFLLAEMTYLNGLATLFAFGGIYAAGTFGMTEQEVLVFGIALNVTAGLGATGFAWVDDWIGGKRTILFALAGLAIPGALILLVESQVLFWVFGLLLGIFIGPVQAASRSFLARLAPERLQNQLFGVYAFAGKATAFLGPLLVGWISYATGSQRVGMSVIIALFVIGFAILLTVPAEREQTQDEPQQSRGEAGTNR